MSKEVSVKIIPGASGNGFNGLKNGEIIIRIKAQPEKGKANRELVKFLSKTLKIPKSSIEIATGKTNRHKRLILPDRAASVLKELAER